MSKKLKIAIIPARKGSKRFPKKNRAKIHGKSLVEHAVLCAHNAKIFDDIVLTTDDEYFFNLNSKFPFLYVRRRPGIFAEDGTSAFEVVSDVLNFRYKSQDLNICYLQPTSPLRITTDIVDSVSDNSVSVHYDEQNVLKSRHRVNDVFEDLGIACQVGRRGSKLENLFFNGLFYWISTENFFLQKGFIGPETQLIETPISRSFDIDYEYQFHLAKANYDEMYGDHVKK
ncbi:cytidylyltransferase domain-containing protein [Roseobacter sp. HKCCD5988]|uniref:cytidylyltransferase domain-containing protein n=1 Tax=Roseobacter sp. HKCCD5988 TaxID=3120338 RepID=UPI0030ED78A0